MQRKLVESFALHAIIKDGNAADTGLPIKSCDLVVMRRVVHYLPNFQDGLDEIYKILKPGGFLISEFANSKNLKSRLRHFFKLRSVPLTPIQVKASQEIDIPFVNHHPGTVKKMIQEDGFVIQKILSVSNFRSPMLKKFLPVSTLLATERFLQWPLGKLYFGPGIFILARRPATLKDTGELKIGTLDE